MAQLTFHLLLRTEAVGIADVMCRGECRHESTEEYSRTTHLVFPYRGAYLYHVGQRETVAESNHLPSVMPLLWKTRSFRLWPGPGGKLSAAWCRQ